MAAKQKINWLQLAAIFILAWYASNQLQAWFFPTEDPQTAGTIQLVAVDPTVNTGVAPVVTITNNTQTSYTLISKCPAAPFAITLKGEPLLLAETADVTNCPEDLVVHAGKSKKLDLKPWLGTLFNQEGQYTITLPTTPEAPETVSTTITVGQPGFFTQLFRTFITKPLYNALLWISSFMPGPNLGLGIIVLTLIIKFLLYFPTKRSLENQKNLQTIQPKIDALKKKHKNNPQLLQKETMKLWKEHGINPAGSCLPLLIQFPILIGLFFIVRDGIDIAANQHLIYGAAPLKEFVTMFLGLDLTKPSWLIMPPLLMVAQFFQMRLAFANQDKKKAAKQKVIDVSKDKEKKSWADDPQQMQRTMMMYGLPLMIGGMAITFPAAVSLYWATSTLFAIGQQVIVNNEK
jgi:YidC/Oxa1 family membrane protein insertase